MSGVGARQKRARDRVRDESDPIGPTRAGRCGIITRRFGLIN